MVTDQTPADERATVLREFPTWPPTEHLRWECQQDPELGWIILAVDTRIQYPVFVLSLSRRHQSLAHAEAICKILARVYNTR